MKKILVIAGILIALVAANMIYNHFDRAVPDKTGGKTQVRNAGKARLSPGMRDRKAASLTNLDTLQKTFEAKRDFCLRSVNRLMQKGRNLDIIEFRQIAAVVNEEELRDYYSCKSVEDMNPRWCEPLKWIDNDVRASHQYNSCVKAYRYKVFLRYLLIESKNRMSLEELDKALADREDPYREMIIRNAKLLLSDSLDDCNRMDEEFFGAFHCYIVKTGRMPDVEGNDDLREYASIAPTLMRAIKEKNPQILHEFDGKDQKTSFFGLFTEEPFCDTAFDQQFRMRCQSF